MQMKWWYSVVGLVWILVAPILLTNTGHLVLALTSLVSGVVSTTYVIYATLGSTRVPVKSRRTKPLSARSSNRVAPKDRPGSPPANVNSTKRIAKSKTANKIANVGACPQVIDRTVVKQENDSAKDSTKFLAKNESYQLQGFNIGGLVYVSPHVLIPYLALPALINMSLSVKNGYAATLVEWPYYADLTPQQRFHFLAWLQNGRNQTDELGYILLYLLGFESYLILNTDHDDRERRLQNLQDIERELKRLEAIPGLSSRVYALISQLLDLLYIQLWPQRLGERMLSFPSRHFLALRYGVAALVNEGSKLTLDSDWALQWAMYASETAGSSLVRSLFPLLRSLYKLAYARQAKSGVKVDACKSKLIVTIATEYRGYSSDWTLPVNPEWCDPLTMKQPAMAVLAILDEVMPEYNVLAQLALSQSYAKLTAYWPEGVPYSVVPGLVRAVDSFSEYFTHNPLQPLMARMEYFTINSKRMSIAKQLDLLSKVASSSGYVVIPQSNSMHSDVKATSSVAVYQGVPLDSLSFDGHRLVFCLQIWAYFVSRSAEAHKYEVAVWNSAIQLIENADERKYLSAYVDWIATCPPGLKFIRERAVSYSGAQLAAIGDDLLQKALSKGSLLSKEIRIFEKIYSSLSLDIKSVRDRIVSTFDRDIVHDSTEFVLNETMLKQYAASTKEVQAILHEVFREDDELHNITVQPTASDVNAWHRGLLDKAHEELSAWLLTSEAWPLDAVYEKCRQLCLMPEGALESINEAAFEAFNESLLELGDPIFVYRDTLKSVIGEAE